MKKVLLCTVMLIMLLPFDVMPAGSLKTDGVAVRQKQTKRTKRARRANRQRRLSEAKRKELAALPTYIACGCGCCGGIDIASVVCLYRSKGDDIQKIIEADKKMASNTALCAVVGCALPIKYVYCD